jgi:hypothetical protein
MALKQSFQFNSEHISKVNGAIVARSTGSISEQCYVKVEDLTGTKDEVSFSASMKGSNFSVSKSFSFVPDMDGPNFIKQAYLHLKSLPEYAGALDC